MTAEDTGRPAPERDGRRRVMAQTFVTLDGYMVGPDEDISWVADGFDREMEDDIAQAMSLDAELFLFGRTTYEMFAAYWPTATPYEEGDALQPSEGREDPRIIRALNDGRKLVASTTLRDPAWPGTRVIASGLEDEVRALRRAPGKAVCIQGSASVVQALARADLIDEYRLYVHPVLLGAGTPLWAAGHARQDMVLTRSRPYANGVVALTYEREVAR